VTITANADKVVSLSCKQEDRGQSCDCPLNSFRNSDGDLHVDPGLDFGYGVTWISADRDWQLCVGGGHYDCRPATGVAGFSRWEQLIEGEEVERVLKNRGVRRHEVEFI